MRTRHSFMYSLSFALVNFAEATVCLVCLGQWSPNWVMPYAASFAKRQIEKQIKKSTHP